MGVLLSTLQGKEPPPKVVLVPPLFDRNLYMRTRMLESAYDVQFSKLVRHRLLEMYFADTAPFVGRLVLQPPDDPQVDMTAEVQVPYSMKGQAVEEIEGDATFRWQRNEYDYDTFGELSISSDPKKHVQVQLCSFNDKLGLGSFAILPLLAKSSDQVCNPLDSTGAVGLRYGTSQVSIGGSISPYGVETMPSKAWLVSRYDRVTAGAQFHPIGDMLNIRDPRHWSFAISYGTPNRMVLTPGFEFSFELQRGATLVASYFHHLIVQRQVHNPFEVEGVVGITNYLDVGLEISHDLETDTPSVLPLGCTTQPGVQLAASWQANKGTLVKGKVGTRSSGAVLALKSWWQPSFTLALAARRDHRRGEWCYGATMSCENFGEVSYERADPSYRMETPTRTHIADAATLRVKERPDLAVGVPHELRPPRNVL
eukprot:SM000202S05908  [mRNA]  locus=s202:171732:175091:- [translate_table: standard]